MVVETFDIKQRGFGHSNLHDAAERINHTSPV